MHTPEEVAARRIRYATSGYKRVEGWLTKTAVRLFEELGVAQHAYEVAGPVCEIGVHLGRTFILLHLLTANREISVAYDLYELQNPHVGRERKRRLADNLGKYGADIERVKVVTADSMRLVPADIVNDCGGRPRFISLDAGRAAAIVRHELNLAADAACEAGLISVTDCFHERWPEVFEGIADFMHTRGDLHPVAIGGGKFFFAKSATFAERYRAHLRRAFGAEAIEVVSFGRPVVVVRSAGLRLWLSQTVLWRALRPTSLGAFVRHRFRRL